MIEKMMDMEEQICALVELQTLDKRIYKLKDEQELKPKRIAELHEEFSRRGDNLKMCEGRLKVFQLKRKDKEVELQGKEENVKKYQVQLYQIKTNKEYTALQKEIEGLKADNSLLEEEIIGFLEEVDRAEQEVAREKEALVLEEKKLKQEELKVEQKMKEIEKELDALIKQRELILPKMEPLTFARYEKVLENRDGYALAEVANDACGGCQMELPPQTINEIKMKQRIVSCEVCSRILYISE